MRLKKPSVNLKKTEQRFSDRLFKLIEGDSKAAFAKRCGFSEGALKNYLNNSMPSADKALSIAEVANVNVRWLITGEGPMRPDDAQKFKQYGQREPYRLYPGSIPLIHLEPTTTRGWFSQQKLRIGAARPGDIGDPDAFAVIATGDSLQPKGIFDGFLCFCSPQDIYDRDDIIFVELSDGKAALKVFYGQDDRWLKLQDFLPPQRYGIQKDEYEQIQRCDITRIATVIYVKRKM